MSPSLPRPSPSVRILPAPSTIFAAAWIASLAGCGSREPVEVPFEPPPLEIAESHFFGTSLSGPRAGEPEGLRPEDAFGVRLTFFGLKTLPADAFDPLATRRTLLSVTGSGKPIQATERLSRGIRVGTVEPAGPLLASFRDGSLGRTAMVAMAVGAVAPGSTWRLRLHLDPRATGTAATGTAATGTAATGTAATGTAATGAARTELLDVEIYFPAPREPGDDRLRVAIARQGPLDREVEERGPHAEEPSADRPPAVGPSGEGPSSEERGDAEAVRKLQSDTGEPPDTRPDVREVSLVEETLRRPGEALGGILPAVRVDGTVDDARGLGEAESPPVAGIAFVLEVSAAPGAEAEADPDDAHAEAFQRSASALAEAASGEVRVADIEADLLNPTVILARAAEALANPATRRRALIYIARETGARVAADLALSGSDRILATMTGAILERLRDIAGIPEEATLGWALEAGTLHAVGDLLDGEERVPELEGVLALHLGQVGRQPAVIERVVAESRSLSDLDARLVQENSTFLEDGSPQARARAFAWLSERGRAPTGYDPLAPARERRMALEKAVAEPTAPEPTAPEPAAPAAQGGNP